MPDLEENVEELDGLDDMVTDEQLAHSEVVNAEVKEIEAGQDDGAEDVPKEKEEKSEEVVEEGSSEEVAEAKAQEAERQRIIKKYRGREYSPEDLLKDEDLFDRINTAANQQAHYQELYEKEKKAREEFEAQRRAEAEQIQRAQQQTNVPSITPDQLISMTKPAVKTLSDNGWIDEDFAEMYPAVTSGFVSVREEAFNRIKAIEDVVYDLVNNFKNNAQSSAKQSAMSQIDEIFNSLSSEGGIFEPLKSQETRNEFLQDITTTLNPMVSQLTSNPDVLRRLWVGKNHNVLLQQAAASRKAAEASAANKRRTAVGEGSGVRSAPPAETKVLGADEGWDDI